MSRLFKPYESNLLSLKNRVVLAPMTRSRALNNVPNDLIAEFYQQRSGAGLIVTEGTSPSPNGLGYSRIPGVYTKAQIEGWKKVTNRVHENGSKIFVQLMHTGRVTHPDNLPQGAIALAPSAVKLEQTPMWVDGKGSIDIPVAKAMTLEDIKHAIQEHIQAAKNAIEAGFDGIEIHGANGYLIKQFLNPHTNKRTDLYGGSIENRSRFLLEVTEGIINAIGKDKVGVRLSPYTTANETPVYDEVDAQYEYLSKKLNDLDIAYLHLVTPPIPQSLLVAIRKNFSNTIIATGNFNKQRAEEAIRNGFDLIGFGRPFIANPDFVDRLQKNLPLNQPKYDLFYTAGAEGYTDYPLFEEASVFA